MGRIEEGLEVGSLEVGSYVTAMRYEEAVCFFYRRCQVSVGSDQFSVFSYQSDFDKNSVKLGASSVQLCVTNPKS